MIAPGSDMFACAALVEKGDPARFRTVMAAPLAARLRLFPLYAFNVEVARAPYLTTEPMIAEMRLQWWRDVLAEIAEGGRVRRHEIATPLAATLSPDQARALDALVTARQWDCYKDPFEDDAHLHRYLAASSGLLMRTAAELLGGPAEAASHAGLGLGVANWLRAAPALEKMRRIPLVDGTADGIRGLARTGLAALDAARGPVPRPALPAFWPATGARRVLRVAEAEPGRVADGTLPAPSRMPLAFAAALGRW